MPPPSSVEGTPGRSHALAFHVECGSWAPSSGGRRRLASPTAMARFHRVRPAVSGCNDSILYDPELILHAWTPRAC